MMGTTTSRKDGECLSEPSPSPLFRSSYPRTRFPSVHDLYRRCWCDLFLLAGAGWNEGKRTLRQVRWLLVKSSLSALSYGDYTHKSHTPHQACAQGGGKWGIVPPPPLIRVCPPPPPPEIGPQKVLTDGYWVNFREKRQNMLKKWVLSTHIPKIFAARFARRYCSCFLPTLGEVSAIFGVKVVKKCQFSALVFDEGKGSPTLAPPPKIFCPPPEKILCTLHIPAPHHHNHDTFCFFPRTTSEMIIKGTVK